ncbi:MAG TPA: hypothetical protein VEK11_17765 [Thermoanaerobaculia bacterium]|nr:hypothetical protein [Thermoanaerobaculia bacterium]
MPVSSRRRWLYAATVGCALVVLVLLVVALVIVDKEHFGWLVGSSFLQIITSGVWAGSLVLLVAAFNLPERRTWRGIALIVWALIALTSPAFGFMFLLPWGVLVLSLPLIATILVTAFRQA